MNPTKPPEQTTGSASTTQSHQNQGIPYQLRRIQVMDAAICAGIMATFAMSWSTNNKVATILAERAADERVEASNPPVREVRYEVEIGALRDHVRAVDGRVTGVEDRLRRR